MEEFKNLEEIIELCKEELENNDENVHATLDLEDLKELRNLINKYEELQKESFEDYKSYFDLVQEDNELLVQKENKIKELEKERDDIYADYQDLGKEKLKLEKENQVFRSANEYWTMRFCEATNKSAEQEKMIELMAKAFKQDDIRNEDEIIEYFRKKAKGE